MRTFNLTYVVEDDKIAAAMVDYTLNNSASFNHVLVFENGNKAIEAILQNIRLKTALPDLILLDLNMPIMDGWEFLEAITDLKTVSHIPIVILTSSIIDSDKERAMAYIMVKGYLPKPLIEENIPALLELLY
jgi:CheY-like chemotaxis protein